MMINAVFFFYSLVHCLYWHISQLYVLENLINARVMYTIASRQVSSYLQAPTASLHLHIPGLPCTAMSRLLYMLGE